MIDLSDLIGSPFRYGGKGEDGHYDCFGLVFEVYKRIGRPLPQYPSSTKQSVNARRIFKAIEDEFKPCDLKPYSILVFRIKKYGSHLAIYLGDDDFIHAWEGAGMVVGDRLTGAWEKRLVGVYEPK